MGFWERLKPLRSLPRFADLTDAEMREVHRAGREVTVPEGWSLISQSTPPDKAYLVIEGSLSVTSRGRQVAELGPGDIVGEIGLRDHRLRTATVSALTPLLLLHFTPTAFNELCDRVPAFGRAVDEAIAERTADSSGRR